MKCEQPNKIQNNWQEYNVGGVIDTTGAKAVTIINIGTNTANINGFPLASGQCISSGVHECDEDCTTYTLIFSTAVSPGHTNSVFVFRGQASIAFSNVIASSGGGGSGNVNIFDSAGNSLNSTAHQLWVVDSGVISAVNTFASANHTDLSSLLTELTTFANQNHTDLGLLATDLTSIYNELLLIKNNTDVMSGAGGCKVATGLLALTGQSIKAIKVIQASAFSVYKIGGVDHRASDGMDAIIGAGAFISAPAGSYITDITISSGQMVYYF